MAERRSSPSPDWTGAAELRAQVERLWDRGLLLRSSIPEAEGLTFPVRLKFRRPTSAELADRFTEARAWIAELSTVGQVRIDRRRIDHRVLGANDVPAAAWLDSLDAAVALIGRERDLDRFRAMTADARRRRPETVAWLTRRPVVALAHADVWPQLLDVVDWLEANHHPGIYVRQVDLPGIDTKFIETYRAVLTELLDLAVPKAVVDADAAGVRGFERRYGFRSKPNLVRFRVLDRSGWVVDRPELIEPPDVTVDATTFAALDVPVSRVYITENETNFLAFPSVQDAMVVWGSGFGTERLAAARWLHDRRILYWGDIDTHGFAILDEVRRWIPGVESFLMDRDTLLAHRPFWESESKPESRQLPRLRPLEAELYDDLRSDRYGPAVRLEQERIGFDWVRRAIGPG